MAAVAIYWILLGNIFLEKKTDLKKSCVTFVFIPHLSIPSATRPLLESTKRFDNVIYPFKVVFN